MPFVIFSTAERAEMRREMITEDAIAAGFLPEDGQYEAVIYHPTDGRGALPVLNMPPVYYRSEPTQNLNFEIFFTKNEIAGAKNTLTPDWQYEG